MQLKVDVNRAGFERVRNATDLLVITRGDLQGPVLTRVAQKHREQERRIFASEGAEGASGKWPRLSPLYAARKKKLKPGARILVWSGDMKDRFLRHGRPENIERFVQKGPTSGAFQLGAQSKVAGYHFSGTSKMPRRDMVTKTLGQVREIWQVIVDWYTNQRLPQAQRALAGLGHTGPIGGAAGRAAAP